MKNEDNLYPPPKYKGAGLFKEYMYEVLETRQIPTNKKYDIKDMVKGDIVFCATGVTSGDLAKGVKDLGDKFEVNTFVLHKSQKIIKSVINTYNK